MDVPVQILPKRVAKSVTVEEASNGDGDPAVLSDTLCRGGGSSDTVGGDHPEGWLRRSVQHRVHKDEEAGINEKAVLASRSSTVQCGTGTAGLVILSSRRAQAQAQPCPSVWQTSDRGLT